MKGKKAKTISLEQLGRFEFRLSTGLCWRPVNFLGFIMVCIFRRIPILGRCMLKYLGINVMMFALRFKENFLYYGWFTMCQFLLHSKVTQFYIYIYVYICVCVYIYKHSFLYYFKWFRKKGQKEANVIKCQQLVNLCERYMGVHYPLGFPVVWKFLIVKLVGKRKRLTLDQQFLYLTRKKKHL